MAELCATHLGLSSLFSPITLKQVLDICSRYWGGKWHYEARNILTNVYLAYFHLILAFIIMLKSIIVMM